MRRVIVYLNKNVIKLCFGSSTAFRVNLILNFLYLLHINFSYNIKFIGKLIKIGMSIINRFNNNNNFIILEFALKIF